MNELLTTSDTQVATELLREARAVDASVTLDELSASRLIASEHNSGTVEEQAAILDAELNRASRRGLGLTAHVTAGTGVYGPQGTGGRLVATRQHSRRRHLDVARRVLNGELRGISQGATRFFNPRVQDRLHFRFRSGETNRVFSCRAEGTLTAWSFDLPLCVNTGEERRRCCPNGMPSSTAKHGPRPQEWIGAQAGIDAYEVMLFRPAEYGDDHTARFEEARSLIRQRSGSLYARFGLLTMLALSVLV